MSDPKPAILPGQDCIMCKQKTLTLTEMERDIPLFGKIVLFSMSCSSCKYHKSDVETLEKHDPAKYTFEVTNKKDLDVRIIKSAEATVKIPHVGDMLPGPASNGFVTNVEGLINRFVTQVEHLRDSAEEKSDRKKAKNLLKKISKVLAGTEKIKISIEDPTGNSAIVSDKAEKKKLKK
ncbi:hypothetical protein COV11_00185 [Candidatus Woesearchaeota archaeon CG10_big_fil_rev_8_21_14_0_10_30_7]|nr:MAG: hypothetical protein COV11_00185 [Candidatus Woesearchaeota archaeon CG10_big_fil_rev_8_21_14_0_10_30_7]